MTMIITSYQLQITRISYIFVPLHYLTLLHLHLYSTDIYPLAKQHTPDLQPSLQVAASDSLVADSVADWVASKLETAAASYLVVSTVLQGTYHQIWCLQMLRMTSFSATSQLSQRRMMIPKMKHDNNPHITHPVPIQYLFLATTMNIDSNKDGASKVVWQLRMLTLCGNTWK